MSDVLSQAEVDALLKGVTDGNVEANTGFGVPPEGVRDFDLSARQWITRDHLPAVDFVNQLFARQFQNSIRNLMPDLVQVTSGENKLEKYTDYITSLEQPTSLNLVNVPQFESQILFVLNADLILNYVDFYFGGDGLQKDHPRLAKSFTATEISLAQNLLNLAFLDLTTAWEAVAPLDFEYISNESNPAFANFFNPGEVMVLSRFDIALEEESVGWLDIVIPNMALEAKKKLLEESDQGDQQHQQNKWQTALEEHLQHTQIELTSTLATTRVSLRDLIRLSPGDIIPVELPPTVKLTAGSVPLFSGTFGVSEGHNAISIIEALE